MSNQARKNRYSFKKRLTAGLLAGVILVSGLGVFTPREPAQAVPAEVTASVPATQDNIGRMIVDTLILSSMSAVGNAVNYFLTTIAYQMATNLADGCPDGPCFGTKFWKQAIDEAWRGALATAITDFADIALGLDVCNPDFNMQIAIQLGLLQELKPGQPRCTLDQISQNWDSFVDSVETGEAFEQMAPMFVPGEAPIGLNLTVMGKSLEIVEKAKEDAKLDKLGQMMNGGWRAVFDPVSKRIVSPSAVVSEEYHQMRVKQEKSGDWAIGQMAGTAAARIGQGIVVNVISVFTQTLIARTWNRMVQGLLSAEEAIYLEPDLVLNYEAIVSPEPTDRAALLEPQFNTPRPRDAGIYNPVEDFMTCPGENRGPQHCVIDAQLATAIEIGRSESMTVREALKRGYLHGERKLVSSNNTEVNQDWNCYSYAYCESNLKKLRAARIIPIGWEIAAHQAGDNTTLQEVVNGFNDCDDQGKIDGTNHKYCHLIDPDWVLKAPVTQCRAMGYTPFLLSPSIPVRHEACVDSVTCLKEDDIGNCIGGWGYCTKERNVWRFMGDSCPEYYNSCRTLTATTTGRTSNLLVNTMDRGICNSDNAGCRAYSTQPNTLRCELSSVCTTDGGCVCKLSNSDTNKCKIAYQDSACSTPAGQTCELGGSCGETSGCNCEITRSCLVQKGQQICDVKAGDERTKVDDWLSSPLLHLNRQAAKCDGDQAGCTALIPLATGQSLNLIRNGGFEDVESIGDTGSVNHARFWLPVKGNTSDRHAGYVSVDGGKSADGQSAASITTSTTNCSISAACPLNEGCPCVKTEGSGSAAYEQFLCMVDKDQTSCVQNVRLRQGGITFHANKTYTFSAVAVYNNAIPQTTYADLHLFDANGNRVIAKSGDVIANDRTVYVSTDGQTYSLDKDASNNACAVWHPKTSSTENYVSMTWRPTTANASGNTYVYISCQFSVVGDHPISSAMLSLGTSESSNAFIDTVQLEEGPGSRFHEAYGANSSVVYAKVAPESMGCTGEEGEPEECKNYAGVCRETEVGCNLYTPVDGGVTVSGLATNQDSCPMECVGYETFKQEATNFDPARFPVYFIPETAKTCSESEVGCTEFTNLENEQLGYYQSLRFCVPEGTEETATYYTWEGSDTTGYQLKTWRLKQSRGVAVAGAVCCADGACDLKTSTSTYCTGISSASDICEGGDCTTGDPITSNKAPCTKLAGSNAVDCASQSSVDTSGSIDGFCSRYQIDQGNLDCREFYDADGHRHFRLASSVVEVTDNCSRFRLGGITEDQCINETEGIWDKPRQACVYRFDTEKSVACSAAVSGCRTFKGNTSGNVRNVFSDDFEGEIGPWYDLSNFGDVGISAQALNVGGHSLESALSSVGIITKHQAIRYLGSQVKSGKTYSVEFWAQGHGSMDVSIAKGASLRCQLAEACGSDDGCTCTEPNTGTICSVVSGDTSCSIQPVASVGPTCDLGFCSSAGGCECVDPITAKSCTVANGQSSCVIGTGFGRITLNSEWTHYRLGPVEVSFPESESYTTSLVFYLDKGANLGVGETDTNFYLDNVVMEEVQANYHLIKNSWNTPTSCDQTLEGVYSPQEMLGCRAYKDIDKQTVALRSFDRLCRERAAGCLAYSDTKNTPDQPYATSYNAVCRLTKRSEGTGAFGATQVCGAEPIKCYLPSVCTTNGGCTCETRVSNNTETLSCIVASGQYQCSIASIAPANGVTCGCDYYSEQGAYYDSCQVQIGSTSCQFTLPGFDDNTPVHEAKDRVRIPADERLYLVAREHMCGQDNMGCKAMAEPILTYEGQCSCNKDNCDVASPNGIDGNDKATCPEGSACSCDRVGGCACNVVDPVTNLTLGVCNVAQGDTSCTAALEKGTVSSWREVAFKDVPADYGKSLCTEEALMCEEFKAKDAIYYLKDPGNKLCEYKEGVTIGGVTRSGFFRKSDSGTLVPCSPELLRGGDFYSLYRNSDQFCALPFSGYSIDKGTCTSEIGCPCSVNGVSVCRVGKGYTTCGYTGWVGECKGEFDRCEEFIDRMQTSDANPEGYPYYYIVNSKLDTQSCKGQASLRQGCVLLDQTSVPTRSYSAPVTYYRSELNNNSPVAPANCDPSLPEDSRPDQCQYRCRRILDGYCSEPTRVQISCVSDDDCTAGTSCTNGKCPNDYASFSQQCVKDSDCAATCTSAKKCSFDLSKSCNNDNDCNRSCQGTYQYSTACGGSDLDCNTSLGEECEDISVISNYSAFCAEENGITGSFHEGNDSNIILKARLDRECSEWLTCNSSNETWDEEKGESVNVCDGFVLCNEAETGSEKARCTSLLRSPRRILTAEDYSLRDTSWYGEDLSGFSIWGSYPIEYVTPVFMPKRGCYSPKDDETVKQSGYVVSCQSDDDCGLGNNCIQMNGVCKLGENYLNERPCLDNSDCNLSGGEFCVTSYMATTRFGAVFDRSITCNVDSNCDPALYGLQKETDTGNCLNHLCVWNINGGGAFEANNNSLASCRSYPEEDSPYDPSVVHPFPSPDQSSLQGGYSRFGNVLSKKENFAGAQVCNVANDCECAYTKITYGDSEERYYSYPGQTSQPVTYNELDNSNLGKYQSAYDYPGICVGGPYDGKRCIPGAGTGAASVKLDTKLDTLSGETNRYSGCGNKDSGGVCRPWTAIQYFRGWPGYCIDQDNSMNKDGSQYMTGCNLWLPVDQLDGAPDISNQYRNAGFNPSDPKIMYCSVAQGNAFPVPSPTTPATVAGDTSGREEGTYEVVIWDESGKERNLWLMEYERAFNNVWYGPKILDTSHDDKYQYDDEADRWDPSGVRDPSDYGGVYGAAGDFTSLGITRNNLVAFKVELLESRNSFYLSPANDWTFNAGDPSDESKGYKTRFQDYYGADPHGINCFGDLIEEDKCQDLQWYCTGIRVNLAKSEEGSSDEPNADVFRYFHTNTCGGDGVAKNALGDHIRVTAILRENCAELQVVHDIEKNNFSSFGWTDRLYRGIGWADKHAAEIHYFSEQETTTGHNDTNIGNLVWKAEGDFITGRTIDGDNVNLFPYGHATVPPIHESEVNGKTTIMEPRPIPVWSTEYGSKYTVVRVQDPEPGETVAQYGMDLAYIANEDDGAPTTNGTLGVAGIPAASIGRLGRSDNLATENNLVNTAIPEKGSGSLKAAHEHGVNTLGQIFAKSWRSYLWDPASDAGFTKTYEMNNEEGAYDSRNEYTTQENSPKLSAPNLDDCTATNPRLCMEETPATNSKESTIGIDPSPDSLLEIPTNSFRAKVLFYAWTDKDHMPIRRLIVDYGDGSDGRITDGWFRNHRGCATAETPGNCDEESKYCTTADPIDEFGRQPQACESSYFSFEHTYICTDSLLTGDGALPACDNVNPEYPCQREITGGSSVCVFKPRVQIMDNWGFCNGDCPGGDDKRDTCWNGENPTLVAAPFTTDQDDADKTFSANECQSILNDRSYRWILNGKTVAPYTAASQEIQVRPGVAPSTEDPILECQIGSGGAGGTSGFEFGLGNVSAGIDYISP